MSKLIKKAFTISVVLTTIVWSIGLFAMPISVVAAESGDLIKRAGSAGVYYVGADGRRYPFPSDREFGSWYDDFSGVDILSDTEFNNITLGGSNVGMKPGAQLIQAVTLDEPWLIDSPTVYAVAGNQTLRAISSAEVAEGLYGSGWGAMILPVPTTVFTQYTVGDPIEAAGDFDKDAEEDAATSINDDLNLGAASGGTLLTCKLAADTPASGVALENSARVPFTFVDCTASADGDITIDSIVMQRTGAVAQDGAFASLALIDRSTDEQIGLNKSLNSSHQATVNDDVVVSAGATKRLAVAGNMASVLDAYAGEIPSLSIANINLKSGATLSATLPITGNYQTLNATVTVASGTLGTGGSNPTADATPEIGKENVDFTQIRITNSASSSENPSGLKVKQIKWTQNGSASDSDLEDIDLVDQDGTVLATAQQVDKKVYHKWAEGSEPTIKAGMNRSYMARGDTTDGTARTISMDIKNYTDILMWDPDHSVYITLTQGSGAASGTPKINGTNHIVGTGTLRIEPAAIESGNIAEGTSQQVLGAFKATVKGEGVDASSIGWHITLTKATDGSGSSTTDITNLTIYDPDGNVVAGPQNFNATERVSTTVVEASATTTDSITFPVGENVYTVKGDLSTDLNTDDTVRINIDPHTITATGEVSGDTITPTPSVRQSSVTNTLRAGALNVSLGLEPNAADVVIGTQGHIFAYVNLDASASSEDIRISQIAVSVKAGSASANELTSLSIFDGDAQLTVSNDPTSGLSATAATDSTSTFTLDPQIILTKATNKSLRIEANVSKSTSAGDTFQIGIHSAGVTATGVTTGNAITPTYNQSDGNNQTLVASGTLALDADSSFSNGLLTGNTDGLTVGVINASAQYEDVKIERIYLTATQENGGGLDEIDQIHIYDGSTLLTSVTPTATDDDDRTIKIELTGNPIVVPHTDDAAYTIKVDTAATSYYHKTTGESGEGFTLSIAAAGDVTAKGAESSSSVTPSSVPTFNTYYVYRSVPTVTPHDKLETNDRVSADIGQLYSQPLYRFKVTASSAGDIALYRVSFQVATYNATVTNWYLNDGTEDIAATTTWNRLITDGNKGDTAIWTFLFTNDNTVPAAARNNVVPYKIDAGATKTLDLVGDVECSSNCTASGSGAKVTSQLLGDKNALANYPGAASPAGTNPLEPNNWEADFIWSDMGRTNNISSTTASLAEQWTNGYLVPNGGGGILKPTTSAYTIN